MLRRISKVLLTLVLALSMVTCFGFTPSQDAYAMAKKAKKPKVTSVELNHKVITIKKGKSLKLKAKVLPKKAAKKAKLTWKTSKKKVATVKKGKVKASKKKKGKVKITVAVKGTKKKAVCTVYVGTPVKQAVLEKTSISLKAGETASAGASVSPENATVKTITYASNNEAVATVDANGQIKAISEGSAVITATPLDEAGKAASLTVTVTPANIAVTGVTLNSSQQTIEKGDSFSLTATVAPANATNKAVTYSSSNPKVATVDANGKVTAADIGTADITVKTADGGKTAVCKVKVVFPAEITIGKISDLNKEVIAAVKSGEIKKIIIKNEDSLNFEIPVEDLSNASLEINAPKGHIENSAKFKDILIKAISGSTFVEHAQGNTINYAATSGTLKVAEEGIAEVSVVSGAGSLKLVNDGSVSALNINTKANVDISGASLQTVQTNISQGATDASIATSLGLNVNSAAKVDLTIREGAEGTTVAIDKASSMPDISGLSRIEVTNNETGDSTFVVATNNGQEGVTTKKVTLSGDVNNVSNEPVSGATVYAIPYTGKLTTAEIGRIVTKAAGKATTASDGSYTIANVIAGNYYILVQKSGYADYSTTALITSENSATCNVPAVTLIVSADAGKTGTLGGSLIDSENGDPVESGLTVMLREGGNNISGDVLQTTTTDSNGQYTVQVVDKRSSAIKHYITTSFDATVSKEGINTVNNTLSYMLDSEQVRFVLTWGNKSSGASADIDSHLVGPKASGNGSFHTWFSDKVYGEMTGDQVSTYADLDRDDVDYEGPETTTIYMKSKGVYSFYVHDYTNLERTSGSTQLSRSSAVVRVYMGNTLKKEFSVPNKEGILWYVCDYDSTTNRITEKNTMSYWPEDDLESIGLSPADLARNYQENLADKIATAEKYLAELKDGNELKVRGQTAVNNAKAKRSSTDLAVLRENIRNLNEWISEVESPLYFEVSGDDVFDYSREEENGINLLNITGFVNDLPEFTVTPDYEDTTCEIKASDKTGYKKMVVIKAASGITRTYYVTYEKSESGASIADVSTKDEEAFVFAYSDYDTSGDESSESELVIYGDYETAPANMLDYLEITPNDRKATVQISKDASGYIGKAVIKSGSNTKTYYISYKFDSINALLLKDITTDEKLSADSDESLIGYTYIDNPEDPEDSTESRTAVIYLNSSKKPTTLKGESFSAHSKVEFKDSDNSEYEKMAVVTYKDKSRKYYISYDYTDWVKYGIKNVSGTDLTDWWLEGDEGDDDTLVLRGLTETVPDDLVIETSNSSSTAEVADSDRGDGKMVVVTYGDSSRKYYIDYAYDDETVQQRLELNNAEIQKDGEIVASGNSCWFNEDEGIYVIDMYGSTLETISADMDFRAEPEYEDATYEVEESYIDGYAAFIRILYGGQSRDYYVAYHYEGTGVEDNVDPFEFDHVELTIDGNVVADSCEITPNYDDNEGINLLVIHSDTYNEEVTYDQIQEGLSVTMTSGDTNCSIEESDKEGYVCKLVLTAENGDGGTETCEYYVRYEYRGE